MVYIAGFGEAEAARILIAAGGHCVAITALGTLSTNVEVLSEACHALYLIANRGGADAIAAIRAVDGTFMDKLRQASDFITAAGLYDAAAVVLAQLG